MYVHLFLPPKNQNFRELKGMESICDSIKTKRNKYISFIHLFKTKVKRGQ